MKWYTRLSCSFVKWRGNTLALHRHLLIQPFNIKWCIVCMFGVYFASERYYTQYYLHHHCWFYLYDCCALRAVRETLFNKCTLWIAYQFRFTSWSINVYGWFWWWWCVHFAIAKPKRRDSWMDLCTCLFPWNQIYAFCIASIGTIFTFNYLWTKRCHCLNYMKFAYCAWSSAVV